MTPRSPSPSSLGAHAGRDHREEGGERGRVRAGVTTPTFDITTYVIEHLHQKFLKDGHPLHVWQAYRWTRRPPRPLPDWVADYFNQCADALLAGIEAEKALGLHVKAGHGKQRQFADAKRDFHIYSHVDQMMTLTRDDLPDDEDLTKDQRAQVAKLFPPRLRGESKLDRICVRLARETQRKGNDWSSEPLEPRTIRNIYFRQKSAKKS